MTNMGICSQFAPLNQDVLCLDYNCAAGYSVCNEGYRRDSCRPKDVEVRLCSSHNPTHTTRSTPYLNHAPHISTDVCMCLRRAYQGDGITKYQTGHVTVGDRPDSNTGHMNDNLPRNTALSRDLLDSRLTREFVPPQAQNPKTTKAGQFPRDIA